MDMGGDRGRAGGGVTFFIILYTPVSAGSLASKRNTHKLLAIHPPCYHSVPYLHFCQLLYSSTQVKFGVSGGLPLLYES